MSDERIVLLVEDEEDLRELMAYQLQQVGFRVLKAGDAEGALHFFRLHPPWVVVTDYSMPRTNGLELARLLKERTPGIPVILWTSSSPADTAPADYVVGDKSMAEVLRILAGLGPTQIST